ncbi:MAG TPA: hypothetical protein ENI87_10920 [bacterium]|nr:hypothetical protein [bacterium]
MPAIRSPAAQAACLLLATFAPAQEDPQPRRVKIPDGTLHVVHEQADADRAKLTVWLRCPGGIRSFADSRLYLADLQARWHDRGAAFAVVLPADDARKLAATRPHFVVATPHLSDAAEGSEGDTDAAAMRDTQVVVTASDGAVLAITQDLDGIVDAIAHSLAGDPLDPAIWPRLQLLLNRVADGGEFAQECQSLLAALPHSGRAHASKVLFHWWCEGDLQAARDAVDAAIARLATEAVPMATFADLVLRGDRADRSVARKLAMAMAPVAAGAPDGVFSQLVYLRALLRAGQDRLAGRVAASLPKLLGGDARSQLLFAETLMEADTPQVFRDLAERAITQAEDHGMDRWVYAARHKVLKRCGDDQAAADLMVAYRKSNFTSGGLNNDAWYLMVRPETMGRFDTLALAQCEEMQRIEGDAIDPGSKDTVALALFVNGRIDEAVALQTEAAKESGDTETYVGRLTRYRATRDELAKAAQSSPGTKR